MRFLHVADVHLGNQQYNNRERCNDFYHAFKKVAQTAVEEKVQICIIAGDLFHKATVDANTLIQAEDCLYTMRTAGIQVIAIEGNHDRIRYQDMRSWMGYLHNNNYLTLLELDVKNSRSCLVPNVSFIDIEGVRFIGVPYYGASTRAAFRKVADSLPHLSWENIRYTVMMTHAGLEDEIPNMSGCVTLTDLGYLRGHISYVAMGHLHKPFVRLNWLHNPGAIENCDFNEARYTKDGKGVFIVDVASDGSANIEKKVIHGRPFYTLDFPIDHYENPSEFNRGLRDAVLKENRHWQQNTELPVIRVRLQGQLAFDKTALDLELIRQSLEPEIHCLLLRFETNIEGYEGEFSSSDDMTFEDLEQQVFEELAQMDSRFSGDAETWGRFMRDVKNWTLDGEAPESIYQHLQAQVANHRGEL